jgi:hypothetical protein
MEKDPLVVANTGAGDLLDDKIKDPLDSNNMNDGLDDQINDPLESNCLDDNIIEDGQDGKIKAPLDSNITDGQVDTVKDVQDDKIQDPLESNSINGVNQEVNDDPALDSNITKDSVLKIKEEAPDNDFDDNFEDILKECSVVLVKDEYDDFVQEVYGEEDLKSSDDNYSGEEQNGAAGSDSDFEIQSKSTRTRRPPRAARRRRGPRDRADRRQPVLDGDAGFSCQKCERTFRNQTNLHKHLSQVKKCKRHYAQNDQLPEFQNHKRKKVPGETEEDLQHPCEKCSKRFVSESSLNRHISKIQECRKYYDIQAGLEDFNTDGLTARQTYYQRNKAKVIRKQREYYQRNSDKVKEKRMQHYRNIRGADGGPIEDGALEGLESEGHQYIAKHKEYYEKNKEVIRARRRNYYHTKKEAVSRKVGKSEFARISSVKNLTEIPDPYEPRGVVKIDNIATILSYSKLFKDNRKRKFETKSESDLEAEAEEAEAEDEKRANTMGKSPLINCFGYGAVSSPGESKIDHEAGDEDEELITMPVGTKLSAAIFDYKFIQCVESFVGLSLSGDGESVEVCQILQRDNITLEAMRRLFHGAMSVLSIDLKTFVQEKPGPVQLFEIKHMHLLKDRLSRELLKTNNSVPDPDPPTCKPMASTENDFLDEQMTSDLPHDQLLVNEALVSSDLGAVGVQWRHPSDPSDQIRINPIFSINSVDHWRFSLRHMYTLLVNWVGGKVILNQICHMLPCMITAKEALFQEVRLDCHNELLKPMETKICEHCGEVFQFSKYTLQSRRAYARHVQLHDHTCRHCGENFPNGTQRKFHERSHKITSVGCNRDNCHYVGNSQQAVDTHIKHSHCTLMCDLCGKETVSQNLKLHMASHHAPKTLDYICAVCGKGYSTKNILDKHIKRHNNPDSLINKWMSEPGEFKFECKEHDNCKGFFKSEKRLREHLKKYGGRSYPNNLARQYVPNLPADHSTVVDSTNIQMDKPPRPKKIKKSSSSSLSSAEREARRLKAGGKINSRPYKKRRKNPEEVEIEKKLKQLGIYKAPVPQRDPHTGRFLKGQKADHRYTIGQGDGVSHGYVKKRDRTSGEDHSGDAGGEEEEQHHHHDHERHHHGHHHDNVKVEAVHNNPGASTSAASMSPSDTYQPPPGHHHHHLLLQSHHLQSHLPLSAENPYAHPRTFRPYPDLSSPHSSHSNY